MVADPFLPYGRQTVEQDDIDAVVDVLQSDWLTTGPNVGKFEAELAELTGTDHAVAVSSGTAALHAAVFAAGIVPGDEVILPPLTFVATSNAVLYQGGTPVFADVDTESLLLDPEQVARQITPNTKAIIAVDYAGQPCDYSALRELADQHGLTLIADACHSLGGRYQQQPVGSQADLTACSFHPVKPLTTAEGGMVLTNDASYAERMRSFRNHGISTDHRQRQQTGTWQYQMTELGYNYRLSDLQCALGISQLKKLSGWIEQRSQLAERYHQQLNDLQQVKLLQQHTDRNSGWHLLVIQVPASQRDPLFEFLRQAGIGANVHYGLVYRHPYYQAYRETGIENCPVAEDAAEQILSLPLFPAMSTADVDRVCQLIRDFFQQKDLSA
jgi:perosamine synthetase